VPSITKTIHPMKKTTFLLLSLLLLGACQSDLDPTAELSAQIGGQTWSARPVVNSKMDNGLTLMGEQNKNRLVISILGGSSMYRPFTAELYGPGIEVLNPAAMQHITLPDIFWASIMYTNTETGESWASMRPVEGSAGQLVVTKADREELVGEFSGTLWGPIRLDREEWKDPRNLRPLKIEKGVVRVQLAD
jgi:hypothetical protein